MNNGKMIFVTGSAMSVSWCGDSSPDSAVCEPEYSGREIAGGCFAGCHWMYSDYNRCLSVDETQQKIY